MSVVPQASRTSSIQTNCRHCWGIFGSVSETPRRTSPSPETTLAPCTWTTRSGNSRASRASARIRTSSPSRLEPMATAAITAATVTGTAQRTTVQSVSEKRFKR